VVEDANGFRHDPNEAAKRTPRAPSARPQLAQRLFDGLLRSAIGRLCFLATLELRVPIGDVRAED
jgi:hypothetical protein